MHFSGIQVFCCEELLIGRVEPLNLDILVLVAALMTAVIKGYVQPLCGNRSNEGWAARCHMDVGTKGLGWDSVYFAPEEVCGKAHRIVCLCWRKYGMTALRCRRWYICRLESVPLIRSGCRLLLAQQQRPLDMTASTLPNANHYHHPGLQSSLALNRCGDTQGGY